jgi:hypothetical protein
MRSPKGGESPRRTVRQWTDAGLENWRLLVAADGGRARCSMATERRLPAEARRQGAAILCQSVALIFCRTSRNMVPFGAISREVDDSELTFRRCRAGARVLRLAGDGARLTNGTLGLGAMIGVEGYSRSRLSAEPEGSVPAWNRNCGMQSYRRKSDRLSPAVASELETEHARAIESAFARHRVGFRGVACWDWLRLGSEGRAARRLEGARMCE